MEFISSLTVNELLSIITREIRRLGYEISTVETKPDDIKLKGIHVANRNRIEIELKKQSSKYPGVPSHFLKVKIIVKGLSPEEETILHELFIRSRSGG